MSFPWIRTAAATLLVTVTAVGCGRNADSVIESPPSTTATTSAPAATPASTATPTPTPASVAGLSAKAIFAKTKAAAFAADSVRVRGSFVESGEKVAIDVHLTKTGGQGTFTIEGAPIGVIVIGKVVYMQLSEKYLRAQGKADKLSPADINATVELLKGKWIKLSKPSKPDDGFDDLIKLTTRDSFFGEIFQPGGGLTKTRQKTVDGVRAIGLSDGEGTLWVDTLTARPVRVETRSDGVDEALRFSDYNQLKAPKAPPASLTMDGRKLGL